MTKVLVITQEKWDTLTEGERGNVWSYMTKVDLDELAHEWVTDNRKGWSLRLFSEFVLAHIKEGK